MHGGLRIALRQPPVHSVVRAKLLLSVWEFREHIRSLAGG